MKLAVVGKEDLDTLEKWVRARFEDVPIRSEGAAAVGAEGVRVAFESNPLGEAQMGVSFVSRLRENSRRAQHVTFAKPVQDFRGLEITFPFPDIDHLYQSKVSFECRVGHPGAHELPARPLSHPFHRPRRPWITLVVPQETRLGQQSASRSFA